MGFVFPQNFNSPYRATGFRDFWRRWHMTLSRFLRDYLYIPLGGNRKGRLRTYRNLMITMILGGLWHGAAWNFVLWGAFHGAGLVGRARAATGGSAAAPRLAALVRHLQPRRASAGSCSARRTSICSATSSAPLVDRGAATLCSVPVVGAIVLVVGVQLLPRAADRGAAAAHRAPAPAGARRSRSRSSSCWSALPCRARASPRSSTSSSEEPVSPRPRQGLPDRHRDGGRGPLRREAPPPRRQPDEPLRARGLIRFTRSATR